MDRRRPAFPRRARSPLPAFARIVPIVLALATPGVAGDRFPLSLKDDRGVTVRLAAPPRRVVSLAPSLTEIVFLLGRQGVLAGVTRYCNVPPAATSFPKVGGVSDPDVERVMALAPDLVLCTTDGNPREKVRALEELGVPCFAVSPQDLDAVFASVRRLGVLLGAAGRGEAEAAALRRRADRARATAWGEGRDAPRVLFAVSTSPVIAAGTGTFMDELVRLSGGANVAAGRTGRYPRLSVEDLLALRPDLVFVAGMAGVERFPEEVTRWKEVPAFRDGSIVTLDGDVVTRPGPRLVEGLEQVSGAIAAWRENRAKGSVRGAGGKP